MSKKTENPETNMNIYQKIQEVKKKIGHISKDAKNDFQKYKYVPEYTYLKIINPILEESKLLLTFEDTNIPINVQKDGKEWAITYQKQVILTDIETEKFLVFKIWGAGQSTDIAKAKGSAETYAVKYFLQKFFMIPTSDNLDPDNDAIEKLYQLYLEKIGDEPTKQETFFRSFDQIMNKYGMKGATNIDNLKMRIKLLKSEEFERIKNYLEKMAKQ